MEVLHVAVIKVVELVGSAPGSFEQAVEYTLAEAAKTIRNIVGVEVIGWTCKVEADKVVEYRTTCKIAFKVDDSRA
jgi:flavin-binding protein dodecin